MWFVNRPGLSRGASPTERSRDRSGDWLGCSERRMGEKRPCSGEGTLAWGNAEWHLQGHEATEPPSVPPRLPQGWRPPSNATDHQLGPCVSSEATALGLTPEETCLGVSVVPAGRLSPWSMV